MHKQEFTINNIYNLFKTFVSNIIEPIDLVHKHVHLYRIAFGKTMIKISGGLIWIMLCI